MGQVTSVTMRRFALEIRILALSYGWWWSVDTPLPPRVEYSRDADVCMVYHNTWPVSTAYFRSLMRKLVTYAWLKYFTKKFGDLIVAKIRQEMEYVK